MKWFRSATGSRTARFTSSRSTPNSFAFFRRYLEVGSVVGLQAVLIKTKFACQFGSTATAKSRGGGLISRGHLHKILTNPIYVGRLCHKGRFYEGQHAAIIDRETWDRVQSLLNRHSVARPRLAIIRSCLRASCSTIAASG